jgi:Family of unknown function (DUF6580)
MKKIISSRTGLITLMILFAGLWQLVITMPLFVPLSDFTPVGAMAIFGGYYYKSSWKVFLIPLVTLWLSDLLLDYFFYYHSWVWFYDGFYWTYLAVAFMVVLGMFMKKVSIRNVIFAGLIATFAHWVITDFGVWVAHGVDITTGKPYPYDFAGFIKSLYLVIPFEKNMLLGNLVFGGILFGVFKWAQRKYPVFRPTMVHILHKTN